MKRANEIAYDFIKSRILDGTYRPAQRLLEAQLADEISVSRNTVKKALLKLEQEQLVTMKDNKGAAIRSLDIDEVVQYLQIREELEVIIIRAAVENIDEESIKKLEDIFHTMEELSKRQEFDTYSKNNTSFHSIIYHASRKPIITSYCLGIKTQLSRFQIKTMLVPERSRQSLVEHRAILEAMKSRNADDAEQAIRAHMGNLLQTIIKYNKLFF
jgi:DNA-binding GntR family transcriptional regulator